jgi:ElaB/YqjD/DUF883 family membrane-anchored ribosome-binding protein
MNNEMETQAEAVRNHINTLADDARAFMAATADVAGEKVTEARKRLASALNSGKEVYGRVRDKTVEKAKLADQTVQEHPYHAMGIAFGVGLLIGVLVTRRSSRSEKL